MTRGPVKSCHKNDWLVQSLDPNYNPTTCIIRSTRLMTPTASSCSAGYRALTVDAGCSRGGRLSERPAGRIDGPTFTGAALELTGLTTIDSDRSSAPVVVLNMAPTSPLVVCCADSIVAPG